MCDHNDAYTRSLERKVESLLWENDALKRALAKQEEEANA